MRTRGIPTEGKDAMNEHSTVHTIADALRGLADRLEATPVRDFNCAITLDVQMQVVVHTGHVAEARRATVDLLATVLQLPMPNDDGGKVYDTHRDSGGVDVCVFTAATDKANPYIR